MPETSILHATILLNASEGFHEALHRITTLTHPPQLTPAMFSPGDSRNTSHAIAFATTYNGLDIWDPAWSDFLLRFEYLLSKSDFDFARLTLETSSVGSSHFLWKRKPIEGEADESLIECPRWYFGTGMRNMHGELDVLHPVAPVLQFDYPLAFNDEVKDLFNAALPELNGALIHTRLFLDHTILNEADLDALHLILTYLELQSVITRGMDNDRLFIIRLRNIKVLTTPYEHYDENVNQ